MNASVRKITAALLATVLVVLAGLFSAGAFGAQAKTLGGGDRDLKPDCGPKPDDFCTALGSVTAFTTRLGDKEDPFRAPADGRIVAWAIELGHKPSDRVPEGESGPSNLDFFQNNFGSEKYGDGPVARLAILKRQQGVQFKLVDQSPTTELTGPFYNEDTVITLERPLRIREGEIVGLTSLTWIPTLRSQDRGGGRAGWRASIRKGRCNEEGIKEAKPHRRLGTTREYGCQFTDRLFYKAYFVPNN